MNLLEIKRLLGEKGCKAQYLCSDVVVFHPAHRFVMDFLCRISLVYNKDWSKAWVRITGLDKHMILRRNEESAVEIVTEHYNKAMKELEEKTNVAAASA